MCMSIVYTSDGPKVGVTITQPAESPHRRVGGGWGGPKKKEGWRQNERERERERKKERERERARGKNLHMRECINSRWRGPWLAGPE